MISILYDVKKYRKAIENMVTEGMVVIEIGPHTGESTSHYVKKASRTVAIDVSEQSRKAFNKLSESNPNLIFIKGDARRFETVKEALKHTRKCDVLAVDLGGGRFPDTVFKVWAVWSGVFKPKNSIIRNRGLAEFIQRAKVEDESLKKDFSDNGWMSEWGRSVPSKLKDQLGEFSLWIDLEQRKY
jgi:hypothetical protein